MPTTNIFDIINEQLKQYYDSYVNMGEFKLAMVDYAIYRGTKVIVHSKNYQNGSATVAEVQPDGTQGPTFWVDIADLNMLDYMHSWGAWAESVAPAKCECGSAKVPGLEGHHSSWCPAFKKDGI